LNEYINQLKIKLSSKKLIYTINGEDIIFVINYEGKVTRMDDSSVICETGGQECLEKWV